MKERMIILKIGARTFKTSLAILLAMIIPKYIGIEDGVGLATAAVIVSMMPSDQETFDKIGSRIVSNIIGGVIAFLVSNYIGDSNLLIAAASAVLIAILNQLNLGSMIGLSTLTTINVMLYPGSNILLTAIHRVSATLVGVLIAFFVNTFVFPPKYDVKFYQLTINLTDNSTKYVRSMLRKNAQFPIMSEDLKELKKNLKTLNKYHKYMMDPVY